MDAFQVNAPSHRAGLWDRKIISQRVSHRERVRLEYRHTDAELRRQFPSDEAVEQGLDQRDAHQRQEVSRPGLAELIEQVDTLVPDVPPKPDDDADREQPPGSPRQRCLVFVGLAHLEGSFAASARGAG